MSEYSLPLSLEELIDLTRAVGVQSAALSIKLREQKPSPVSATDALWLERLTVLRRRLDSLRGMTATLAEEPRHA